MPQTPSPPATDPVTLADRNAVRALTTVETAERLAVDAYNALAEPTPDLAYVKALLEALVDTTTATTATLVKGQGVSDAIARDAIPAARRTRERIRTELTTRRAVAARRG